MEARWRAAGQATELRVWEEAPHGFVCLPMTVAEAALSEEHEFLTRTLDLDRGSAAVGSWIRQRADDLPPPGLLGVGGGEAQPAAGGVLELTGRADRRDRAGVRVAPVGSATSAPGWSRRVRSCSTTSNSPTLWGARRCRRLSPHGRSEKIAGAGPATRAADGAGPPARRASGRAAA